MNAYAVPLLFVLLGLAAPPSPPTPTETLRFYHWWTAPSEAAALDALVDAFKSKYPNIAVEPTFSGRGVAAVLPILKTRAAAGDPPEVTFAHGGYSPEPLVEAGLLSPVDDVWKTTKLTAVVPAVVDEMSQSGGRHYVVPLGIHRDNVVWYNQVLLTRHQIDPRTLTTWDALFAAAKKLRAGGVSAPIQMGTAWTAVHAFACIVAGQGLDAYEDWANGKIRKPGDPRMVAALTAFKEYVGYANKDHAELSWDAAIQRVVKGEGAFSLMGDWADGVFRGAALEYGKEYGALPVPGTHGMYGVTLDGFVRLASKEARPAADRMLSFIASREGQDIFNSRKGSIPARTDGDLALYSPYQKSAIADFKDARFLFPGFGTATPDVYQAELEKILTAFSTDLDVAKADRTLAETTVRLAARYTRVWKLK